MAQTNPRLPEHKQVLVLYSYGYGGRGVELFSSGLLSVVNGAGLSVNDLYPEYLDLERNKAPAYRPGLRDFLTEKHRDRRFDLIIAVQQPALDFLLHDGRGIAAGVPVITVQAPMPSSAELDGRWFVSQLTRFDIPGTIQRALEAFPQTRRILFVSGSSDADRQMAAAAAEAAVPWQGKLDFEFTTGLSANEILERVAHLPAQSIIVYTQYNVDTTGQVALAYEMEGRIIKVANAPVFGLYDFNLVNGGIGGSVVGVGKLGETTGRLALDILNGTFQPRQPITAVDNAALPMFDWAQILRWGGNPDNLPQGTIFINVPQTLFGQYREYVVGSIVFFLAQSVLIVALLLNRRRRKVAENLLSASETRFRALVEEAPDAIVVYDVDLARLVDANPRAEEIFGCPRDELLTAGPDRYFVPAQPDGMPVSTSFAKHIEWVLAGNPLLVERHILNSAGQALVCEVRLANLPSAGHRLIRASFIDITERKSTEARIEFLANHDVLTGLPNRLLLGDRLDKSIAQADRAGTKLALLFLDLDNFKSINDSLGHSIGDALLQAVAARLSHCVRETDSIGRQGGDEFLMFLTGLSVADATAAILQKIIDTLQTPFDIEGNEITTSVSIGVAIYPDDGRDFDTLRKKADTAMYRAKDAGRNTYAFFDEQMNVDVVEHQRLRGDLRRALDRDEFVLHYQPQIDLTSGAIVGAEALIRWSHPQLGLLPPGRFIALAEDCGLIVPIGEWALYEACRQAAAWSKAGVPKLTMAVNLSAVQFKRGNLGRTVTRAIDAAGIDPSWLELELTESILIQDTESVLATVKTLKSLGVQLSIDDFGTGYSSLSYLKRFNVDKLKIDQSFVRDIARDPNDAAIVNAIVQMAHSLNLRTIAEGVEEEQMLHHLRAYNCDEAQGYYFARPMPAEDFPAWRLPTADRQADFHI